MYDLGEAPQAYKDIDAVIQAELDLIEPIISNIETAASVVVLSTIEC
jgi:hypothetical protein